MPVILADGAVKKRCHICGVPLVFKAGGSLRKYRCTPCESEYNRVIRRLKRAYPLPDNHSCACCGRSGDEIPDTYSNKGNAIAKFCLDHDHSTGTFRGWLCVKCNTGLGLLQDSPSILRSAATYLEKTKGQPAKDCPVCISAITKCMFCP